MCQIVPTWTLTIDNEQGKSFRVFSLPQPDFHVCGNCPKKRNNAVIISDHVAGTAVETKKKENFSDIDSKCNEL